MSDNTLLKDIENMTKGIKHKEGSYDDHGYSVKKWGKLHKIRGKKYIPTYGYSIPSRSVINAIVSFSKPECEILECGAGKGVWARLLSDRGIKVVAIDKKMSDGLFFPVKKMDSLQAIKKYNKINILMMVWPPYEDPIAYKNLKKFKGDKLIYIGENRGDATADYDFYDLLEEKWDLVKDVKMKQFPGLHDTCKLFVRKK